MPIVYLADLKNLPYGNKPLPLIRNLLEKNFDLLVSLDVQRIIVACHTASTQVRESDWQGVPIANVLSLMAQESLKVTQNKHIGVLATRATVESKAFEHAINSEDPTVTVVTQACPLFVPLIEEGWWDDPVTHMVAKKYLEPLHSYDIDTLILGCTHYPLIKMVIEKYAPLSVKKILEAGPLLLNQLKDELISNSGDCSHSAPIRMITTVPPNSFWSWLALQFLGSDLSQRLHWEVMSS